MDEDEYEEYEEYDDVDFYEEEEDEALAEADVTSVISAASSTAFSRSESAYETPSQLDDSMVSSKTHSTTGSVVSNATSSQRPRRIRKRRATKLTKEQREEILDNKSSTGSIVTLDSTAMNNKTANDVTFTLRAMIKSLDSEETPLYDADANLQDLNDFSKLKLRKALLEINEDDDKRRAEGRLDDELEDFLDSISTKHDDDDEYMSMDESDHGRAHTKRAADMDLEPAISFRSASDFPELFERSKSIIKEIPLLKLSNELAKRTTRVRVGTPTVINVTEMLIGIGTSQGLVLLFSAKTQDIQTIIGSVTGAGDSEEVYHSVTCFDFSSDGEWIVVGYSSGQVAVYDIKTATALRKITDAFKTPVEHVAFLHQKRFIASDQNGTVKLLTLSKMLFRYAYDEKLLSDKQGLPALDVSAFTIDDMLHPLNGGTLISIANKQKISILYFANRPELVYEIFPPERQPGEYDAILYEIPYVSWKKKFRRQPSAGGLDRQRSDSMSTFDAGLLRSSNSPALAVGWGRRVLIYELQAASPSERFVELKRTFIIKNEAIGVEWINDDTLMVLDSEHRAIVLDLAHGGEMNTESSSSSEQHAAIDNGIAETHDISRIERTWHSDFKVETLNRTFNSNSNTIERVEPAKFFHQSACSNRSGTVFVMGKNVITSITIKTWRERIDVLKSNGFWDAAIELGIEFFDGSAHMALGLPTERRDRENVTYSVVSEMIISYLDAKMDPQTEDRVLAKTCIDFCLRINGLGLLYNQIEQRFKANGQMGLFMDLLYEPMRDKRLLLLPRKLFFDFCQHYADGYRLPDLETCLINVDVSKLDFDEIMDICNRYELYSAFCNAYNVFKNDYIQPIRDLLVRLTGLKNKLKKPEPGTEKLYKKVGHYVLSYLSKCITGNILPTHKHRLEEIKIAIIELLFLQEAHSNSSRAATTTRRQPTLQLLFEYDPQELFELLSVSLEDKSPTTPWRTIDKQAKMEILFSLMVDKNKGPEQLEEDVEPKMHFFLFLAKFLARGEFNLSDEAIHRVFTHVADGAERQTDIAEKIKYEGYLISILQTFERLEKTKFSKFIMLSKRYNLHRLSMYMFKKLGNMDAFVDALLTDLQQRIEHQGIDEVSDALAKQFLQQIFGSEQTLQTKVLEWVVQKLQTAENTLRHLQGQLQSGNLHDADALAAVQSQLNLHTTVCNAVRFIAFQFVTKFFEQVKSEAVNNDSLTILLNKKGVQLTHDFHFLYVNILNQYQKEKVVEHLRDFADQKIFDIDSLKDICKENAEAKSFLLEATGQVAKSIRELVNQLSGRIQTLQIRLQRAAHSLDTEMPADFVYNKPFIMQRERTKLEKDLLENLDDYRVLDDPPFFDRNRSIEDQIEEALKKQIGKKDLPRVDQVDAIMTKECKDLCKEVDTAIKMICHNTDRKILKDREVEELWFMLLNRFVTLIRQYRYGFLDMKFDSVIEPVRSTQANASDDKKAVKSVKSSDNLDDFTDLDDLSSDEEEEEAETVVALQAELGKTLEQIQQMEQDAQRELDQAKKDRIEQRIEAKRTQIQRLKTSIKLKEEEDKKLAEEMRQRDFDQNQPHNVHRLANLWLQRCAGFIIRKILRFMTSYVDIPSILTSIVNYHKEDEFIKIRKLILMLLASYAGESRVLRTADALLLYDTAGLGNTLYDGLRTYTRPKSIRHCSLCKEQLNRSSAAGQNESEVLMLFWCGHIFHQSCLPETSPTCPFCYQSEKTHDVDYFVGDESALMALLTETGPVRGAKRFAKLDQVNEGIEEHIENNRKLISDLLGDDSKNKGKGANEDESVSSNLGFSLKLAPEIKHKFYHRYEEKAKPVVPEVQQEAVDEKDQKKKKKGKKGKKGAEEGAEGAAEAGTEGQAADGAQDAEGENAENGEGEESSDEDEAGAEEGAEAGAGGAAPADGEGAGKKKGRRARSKTLQPQNISAADQQISRIEIFNAFDSLL